MVAAGCTADLPEKVLQSRFRERMSVIIGLTVNIHQAVGEENTGDLEVIWIPSDDMFNPATMEDISGQDRRTDRVL
jgi:hypothetical protein